jgi:phosphopantothenoylcysteine decarboxylase/phosphopantothenate--cysteine ligase
MDLDMWIHPATKSNIQKLTSYGNKIIPVGHGELASGLVGDGRMAEPEDIIKFLELSHNSIKDLADKNIIITAGPTFESIDPVRYIGNHSTGRMGISLAEECIARGAKVKLILGPTDLRPSNSDIKVIPVRSAQEMHDEVMKDFNKCDVVILAAAVADYRPKVVAHEKIKKGDGGMSLELTRTIDIAQALGQIKNSQQITIGFALETTNELQNAKKKLLKKNFDFIVLNSLKDEGAGFAHNTNKVSIVHKDDTVNEYALKSKNAVAKDIIDELVSIMSK